MVARMAQAQARTHQVEGTPVAITVDIMEVEAITGEEAGSVEMGEEEAAGETEVEVEGDVKGASTIVH